MAIYRLDGSEITTAYDIHGNALTQAYDINGNPLMSYARQPLKVMTYNVQHFSGINNQTEMQQTIINNDNPDIIGFQELTTTASMPSLGKTVLSGYTHQRVSQYMGIVSKIDLYDTTITNYTNQDPEDTIGTGENRSRFKTHFNFNGKKICLINTHLCWETVSYNYLQFAELFETAQAEEYVILVGDFNTNFASIDSDFYENTFKLFVDAGYKMANNSPTAGITKTYCNNATATSLAEFSSNPDSIIVSGNIDIDSVVFDTTKLNYLDGNKIDHIPVMATVLI